MSNDVTYLARIYPLNPNRGYHVATYLLSNSKYPMFRVERGWYEVDADTAEYLSELRNNPEDSSSKPVFQVCTHEEGIAIDEAEIQRIAAAEAPVPMPGHAAAGRRAASFISKGAAFEKKRTAQFNARFGRDTDAVQKITTVAEQEDAFDAAFTEGEDMAAEAPPVRSKPDLTTADLNDAPVKVHARPKLVPAHRQSDGATGTAKKPVAAPSTAVVTTTQRAPSAVIPQPQPLKRVVSKTKIAKK